MSRIGIYSLNKNLPCISLVCSKKYLRNPLLLLNDLPLGRIAYGMIKDAEDKGLITPGKVERYKSYIHFPFSP